MGRTAMKGLYKRDGIWHIDCQYQGQRLRQAVGASKTQAVAVLTAWKTSVIQGLYFPTRSERQSTVRDVLNAYAREHLSRVSNPDYRRTQAYRADRIDALLGSLRVEELTTTDAEGYARDRTAEGVSTTTIRGELNLLSSALRHCVATSRECRIARNPLPRMPLPRRPRLRHPILDDGRECGQDWQRLYAQVCPENQPVVLALYESGIRPSHIWRLRWEWIERVTPTAWVVCWPAESDKTESDYEIPVSARWRDSLEQLGPVEIGVIYPERNMRTAFENALDRAGLSGRGYSVKTLRKTRATIWQGIDSGAARYALGHAPIDVHEGHYVRVRRAGLMRLVGIELEARAEFRVG